MQDFDAIIEGRLDEAAIISAIESCALDPTTIVAAAMSLRRRAAGFKAPADSMDCCGTGGDNSNSLNVSTATAFVLAACGVNIAKHGNRAVTSQSGSSDVLGALGININATREVMEKSLLDNRLAFIQAPLYHPALVKLAPIRKKIGHRTIFNLLGPLCNPANVKFHLIGVYEKSLCRTLAEALLQLGSKSAWIVNGGGMDEISISSDSHVACLKNGAISEFSVSPADAGLPLHPPESIVGGNSEYNAKAMLAMLAGDKSAYRDAVRINAAAALAVAGKTDNLEEGAAMAATAIDSGRALDILNRMRKATNVT